MGCMIPTRRAPMGRRRNCCARRAWLISRSIRERCRSTPRFSRYPTFYMLVHSGLAVLVLLAGLMLQVTLWALVYHYHMGELGDFGGSLGKMLLGFVAGSAGVSRLRRGGRSRFQAEQFFVGVRQGRIVLRRERGRAQATAGELPGKRGQCRFVHTWYRQLAAHVSSAWRASFVPWADGRTRNSHSTSLASSATSAAAVLDGARTVGDAP